jgi:hypothetical protein
MSKRKQIVAEIAFYIKGFIKVYTNCLEIKRRLLKVRGAAKMCWYKDTGGEVSWDFIVPNKRTKTVQRIIDRFTKPD